jgi:hypothetical protein
MIPFLSACDTNYISPRTEMIIYTGDDVPKCHFINNEYQSIFLAGPTERIGRTKWRLDAISILRQRGYKGYIIVPEFESGDFEKEKQNRGWGKDSYRHILKWETYGLNTAQKILFWMPFNSTDMPGYTTRAEFGTWIYKAPEKLIVGLDSNLSTGYIRYHCEENKIPIYTSLEDTIDAVLN